MYNDKGLGSIRGFFGLRFSENVKFLTLVVYTHIKYAQTAVCMDRCHGPAPKM